MPEPRIAHKAVAVATFGLALLSGTSLFAEHRDDVRARDLSGTERSQWRNNDLSGGFFDDRYKIDDWFYDYYDSPGAARSTNESFASTTTPSERARVADAAHPSAYATRDAGSRADQESMFARYYDEPWFYDQRDPAYGMPMVRAQDDAFRANSGDGELVKGSVQAIKQVRNRSTGGQNTVVMLRTADGRRVISDLGPTRETVNLALTQGDLLSIKGHREDVGPYSVLMADRIKAGTNQVVLNRQHGNDSVDNRQVEGRIEQFRDIRVRHSGQTHRMAAVRTNDGGLALVDFGPSTAENVPANAAPNDRIVATGPVTQVGNYPVLFANRVSVNDGIPVRITRPDGEYIQPARRPFEASQQVTFTNPSCIGGGCESHTVSRSTPRDPLSNAMDGTIRSTRPEPQQR